MVGFKNSKSNDIIPLEILEREYCRLMSQPYPITEMVFVRSWMLFRVSYYIDSCVEFELKQCFFISSLQLAVISQGIAARYARRQASSERAFIHAQGFPIVGALARKVLEDKGISFLPSAKL
jgi:hypothetical protein